MKHLTYVLTILLAFLMTGCNGKLKSNDSGSSDNLSAEEAYKQSVDKVVLVMCYQDGVPYSQGSGFFIDENTLVTNYHVIEGGTSYAIKFAEKEEMIKGVTIVKASPDYDLAILKTRQSFPFFKVDSLGKESVGSKIYTIGNPRGLEGTISEGIISGKRKNEGVDYIQITAPISPGNSGGPVLNEKGDVIGVSTFTFRNSQNLNFAMPISYVNKCVDIASIPQKQTITKSDSTAISLVSYSKGWEEGYQQVSFHNNSVHSIKSITGVFVYYRKMVDYKVDYSLSNPYSNWKYYLGDIFHYQVFSINVDIAPKMSKLVTIKCDPELYEHKYCESERGCTGCGRTNCIHFDCKFRLLSYEIDE